MKKRIFTQKFMIVVIFLSFLNTAMADVFSKEQHTWPAGVIPYVYHSNVDSKNRDIIKNSMQYYSEHTNITFVEVTQENKKNFPHHVQFVETALIDNTALFTLCDIGAPVANGVTYARLPHMESSTALEMQHCLARVIGLHDEIKRSDRDDFIDINDTYWKAFTGELLYAAYGLDSGSFSYGMINEEMSYNYGDYNYRGILSFNDVTEAKLPSHSYATVATIKANSAIESELYFDEKDGYFIKEFSHDIETMTDFKGPFYLLNGNASMLDSDNILDHASQFFTDSFMATFNSENASLSEVEKIKKLQVKLRKVLGYKIVLQDEASNMLLPADAKSLLVIQKISEDLQFHFYNENGEHTTYTVYGCNCNQLKCLLDTYKWDDTRLSILESIVIFKKVLAVTAHEYDFSSNILHADLVWFNQQTVDAINSVYMQKADLDALPWSFYAGLYYEPCKSGYKELGALCVKGWFRYYYRGVGSLSAQKLSISKQFTQF